MSRRYIHVLVASAFVAMSASPVRPSNDTGECFDAQVSATIAGQSPTVIPECDDCIIMTWPWIVDLRVRRVHEGSVARREITVLSLQHTYYRTDLGARRWFLRRNALGGFNVVVPSEGGALQRCSAGTLPARPFIRPADGKTLDDLRREGEARYGRRPIS